MKYFKILLFISFLYFGPFVLAQKPKNKNGLKSIDSLTKKMQKQSGLITSYYENDKVFFELSDSLLEKDLLMVSRFVQLPSNYQAYLNAGSKTSQQLINFKKKGTKISFLPSKVILYNSETSRSNQLALGNNSAIDLILYKLV